MSDKADIPMDVDTIDVDVADTEELEAALLVDDEEQVEDGSESDADEVPTGTTDVAASDEEGETEVVCPGCGLTLVGEAPARPSAAWFCPRCDYPLFWAKEPEPDARPASRAARRRLPGTGGRVRAGAEACWHCGEMSEPGDDTCRRCAATLPKPLAPHVEVERQVPVPVPVIVRATTWPFVAAAACGGAAVAIALTSWLVGGGG